MCNDCNTQLETVGVSPIELFEETSVRAANLALIIPKELKYTLLLNHSFILGDSYRLRYEHILQCGEYVKLSACY